MNIRDTTETGDQLASEVVPPDPPSQVEWEKLPQNDEVVLQSKNVNTNKQLHTYKHAIFVIIELPGRSQL